MDGTHTLAHTQKVMKHKIEIKDQQPNTHQQQSENRGQITANWKVGELELIENRCLSWAYENANGPSHYWASSLQSRCDAEFHWCVNSTASILCVHCWWVGVICASFSMLYQATPSPKPQSFFSIANTFETDYVRKEMVENNLFFLILSEIHGWNYIK